MDRSLDLCCSVRSTATSSGSTGTGTTTATAAKWVGRGNGKTGAVSRIKKIYLDSTAGGKQSLFNQKINTIFCKSLIVVFWLVQSQSQ